MFFGKAPSLLPGDAIKVLGRNCCTTCDLQCKTDSDVPAPTSEEIAATASPNGAIKLCAAAAAGATYEVFSGPYEVLVPTREETAETDT